MSYTQVTIDGKKVGLKYGLPSHRMLQDKIKQIPMLIGADGTLNEAVYAYILYFGYLNNCMIKEEANSLKYADFAELTEDPKAADEIAEAIGVWLKSKEVVELVKKTEDNSEAKKKSGNGMNSKRSAMVV